MRHPLRFAALLVPLALAGCATAPVGPQVMVLPGSGSSFDQFRADDMNCRDYAQSLVGGPAPDQVVASQAVLGAAVGAAFGAAVGGGEGAAVGAGTGAATGTLSGAGTTWEYAGMAQQRYDATYVQCMYSLGHQVPVSGQIMQQTTSAPTPAQSPGPQAPYYPPPPPGAPPPAPEQILGPVQAPGS